MRRIKRISRVYPVQRSLPAGAFLAETPKERYKNCEAEQATLIGKAACYRTFVGEKLAEK